MARKLLQPMIRNYLKTAIRNLWKNKGFSAINIAGLAIGLCGSIFIFLWVQEELSYDRENPQPNEIYRVLDLIGDTHAATGPFALAPVMQRLSPAVRQAVRFYGAETRMVAYGGKRFIENQVWYADSNFQQLFNFPLVKGDPKRVLQTKDGILITESMARKYFGDEDPMGRHLQLDGQKDVLVEGVLKDLPANSHLQFDFLLPMSIRVDGESLWNNFTYYNYLRLDQSTANNPDAIAGLEKQIDKIFHEHNPDLRATFSLQPLTKIHLGPHYFADVPGGGSLQYVRIFSLVAIFILMIACINFMNLSTALSGSRAKEVGLRKTVGALRGQLIGQFLGEAVFLALIALGLSVALVWALLPMFNELTGKSFSMAALGGSRIFVLLGITLSAGLVAGSYPAFFLSGFKPVMVLKGMRLYQPGRSFFRNGLVVLQFTIAIALIVGTIVVYRQLQFIRTRDIGFDKSNLLYVTMPIYDTHVDVSKGAKMVDQGLADVPGVVAHSVASDLPTDLTSGQTIDWAGRDIHFQPMFALLGVDENFLPTFGAHLLKGRFFSKDFGNEDSNVVVNETALKMMHMDPSTAVGKIIRISGQQNTIIGVVRDFNFKPVQFTMQPLLLLPNFTRGNEYVVVKTEPGAIRRVIPMLQKTFRAVYPDYPFSYGFVDQDLNRLYASDQRMGQLFNVFCILAVFICCLGLLGLSAYTTQRRAKEIGVRKVLGASVTGVVRLLAWEFLVPVILAALIAFPLAGWMMAKWLDDFAYRIGLEWWIFAAAGVSALSIALGTVSFHAINAALSNPVKALRSE